MKKQFVDFETAKMLKELAFNEECIAQFQQMEYPINDSGNDYNKSLCLTIDCETSNDEHKVIWIDKENAHFHWTEGNYDNGEHSRCELLGKEIDAPLWQQVENWLLKEHSIIIPMGGEKRESDGKWDIFGKFYDSPFDAKIEGIQEMVEHLHNRHIKTK